ncbi:MAG: TraB/VirB10 family protein [Sulfurimonas sp.]|jgi:hypothetical protein
MNHDEQKRSSINVLSKIEVFFKNIKNIFESKVADAKLHKENKKERYDIGVDDIHAEYKNIPKRIGFLTLGLGVLVMLVMTILTVREQVSQVDKDRKAVEPEKLKEGEVDISIDEQGWKHYQSKRIDIVVGNTKKEINATREEIKQDNLILQENVRRDLNQTVDAVRGYAEKIDTKIEEMKSDISGQLKQQMNDVDTKVRDSNKELMTKIQTSMPMPNVSNTPLLDNNSKLLPPPLGSLSTKTPGVKKREEKVYVEPDADGYDYSDIEINDVDVKMESISTSLYVDTNVSAPEKIKLHIMKGLVNATLITGINAPTFGGGGTQNPAPVLLSVDGNTLIANNDDEVIENCLVAGSATGNVNTSKADILLTDISCSGHDKEGNRVKIEQPIKGWVIGEDGSYGLSGRLLDSSGKVITKMIALEVIQGLTAALVASSQPAGAVGTFSTAATGSQVTATTYPDAAQGGLGKGINKGLDHAYEHYNQILSGMYPTISVLAGKKITISLKGGEDITPSLYRGVDIYEEIEVE